jgi:hypothetical protein
VRAGGGWQEQDDGSRRPWGEDEGEAAGSKGRGGGKEAGCGRQRVVKGWQGRGYGRGWRRLQLVARAWGREAGVQRRSEGSLAVCRRAD